MGDTPKLLTKSSPSGRCKISVFSASVKRAKPFEATLLKRTDERVRRDGERNNPSLKKGDENQPIPYNPWERCIYLHLITWMWLIICGKCRYIYIPYMDAMGIVYYLLTKWDDPPSILGFFIGWICWNMLDIHVWIDFGLSKWVSSPAQFWTTKYDVLIKWRIEFLPRKANRKDLWNWNHKWVFCLRFDVRRTSSSFKSPLLDNGH